MIQTEDGLAQGEWWGEAAAGPMTVGEETGPVTIAHVADHYNRYPSEVVTFYTRLEINEAQSDLKIRIRLPQEVTLGDYRAIDHIELMPDFETGNNEGYMVWSLNGDLPAGSHYEFCAETIVAPTHQDFTLTGQAIVYAADGSILTQENVNVAIWAKGRYVRHLPSIYERDDLMGRFLMLFESFWSPIETQIDATYNYFDPRITAPDFLPWLATWLDLEIDERWPEEQLRKLLRWAIALHRSRGTKWGLLKYLEIYTGQQAEIIERRAKNFVLGAESRLGPGIALGQGNTPHTFTVKLQLPPLDIDDKTERKRQEELRRRTIEAIIDMQKPAHTIYSLEIESSTAEKAKSSAKKRKKKARKDADDIAAQAAIWFKLDD